MIGMALEPPYEDRAVRRDLSQLPISMAWFLECRNEKQDANAIHYISPERRGRLTTETN
jgi:hypothetical protein